MFSEMFWLKVFFKQKESVKSKIVCTYDGEFRSSD